MYGASYSAPFVIDSRSYDTYSNFIFEDVYMVGKIQSDEDNCIGHKFENWEIKLIDGITSTASSGVMNINEVNYVCSNLQFNNIHISGGSSTNLDYYFTINEDVSDISLEGTDGTVVADSTSFRGSSYGYLIYDCRVGECTSKNIHEDGTSWCWFRVRN